jgi:hypothetical protein
VLSALAGCSQAAVPVAAPSPPAAAADTCGALLGRLPRSLDGRDRRETSPRSPYTAAWGDPAVVLRCGVGRPAALRADSQLVTVEGVDWFFQDTRTADGAAAVRFTTTGRTADVEVTVPGPRAAATAPLVDLAPAVRAADPVSAGR